MKKILFVFPSTIIGGIETLFATLLQNLFPKYKYFSLIPNGMEPSWVKINIPSPIMYSGSTDLANKIDLINPNLIVGAFNYTLGPALLKCKRNNYLVLETSHNVLHSSQDSIRLVQQWLVNVVCVSISVQKHIHKTYTGPSTVILTGVNTNKFKPAGPLNTDVRNYAYFGRLANGDKHVNKLLDAFAAVPGVNLNLYGTAHTLQEQRVFAKNILSRKTGAKIYLKGFVNNPEEHIPRNDVIVVRSEAEGFCNIAAEAFACKVPFVSYDFGGVLDHVPEKSCLKAKTQEEFIGNLKAIKILPLRNELVNNAYKFVTRECTHTVMTAKYEKVFDDILVDPVIEVSDLENDITAICTQHSNSILHSMEEYCDKTVIHPYGDHLIPTPNLRSRKVVVNGFGKNYKQMIQQLSARGHEVYGIYHGSFFSFNFSYYRGGELENFQAMIDLYKSGAIKRLGFVDQGFAELYKSIGYDAYWTPNIIPSFTSNHIKAPGKNIGVFTGAHENKGTYISMLCASMIPDAVIHTIYPFAVNPIPGINLGKVITYPYMTKPELLNTLGKMSVTITLSLTESFGMLAAQSMSVNTPCIVGPACKPLLSPDLMDLYVERVDDPVSIVSALCSSLNKKDYHLESRVNELRSLALSKRDEFLS